MSSLALTVLGTGDAFGSGGHPYSSYLLEAAAPHGDSVRALLVDCGPTALPMLKGMGYGMEKIDVLLLTHLHGDHIAGVPFLFLEYQYNTKRNRPLTVAGPPGTEEICESLFENCYPGAAERNGRKFEVRYQVLAEGETADVEGIRVQAERVVHGSHVIPYGYRIEWEGKTIGWSGDTEWTEALTRLAGGTDLFICECFTTGREIPGHLSVEKLQQEVHRLRTKRLLLTHMGDDVREKIAGGNTSLEAARDGQRIEF